MLDECGGLWRLTPHSTKFQLFRGDFVVVSFIGGGNRSIRRKPRN